jgi:hypothetical protein
MGLGLGSNKVGGSHAAAFLLGVALPTALLFMLASDRLGDGLSSISRSWGSAGTTQLLPVADDGAAPTRDQEVTLSQTLSCRVQCWLLSSVLTEYFAKSLSS